MRGMKKVNLKKVIAKVEMIFGNIKIYDFDKKSATVFSTLKADKRVHCTIDMTLFTDKEKVFIDRLQVLISQRIDALSVSADEMLKASFS